MKYNRNEIGAVDQLKITQCLSIKVQLSPNIPLYAPTYACLIYSGCMIQIEIKQIDTTSTRLQSVTFYRFK